MVAGFGLVQAAEFKEGESQVVMGISQIRVDLQRQPETRFGLV